MAERAGAARRGRPGTPPSQPPRTTPPDPCRLTAYRLLRAVDAAGAYANLTLPGLIAEAGLSGRDAALATELGYGTLRAAGTLDEIVTACVDRPLADVQPDVLDLLRLGGYQLLRTRIPRHAAVATTVDLARVVGAGRATGFVNAVLRRVAADGWDGWVVRLAGAAPTLRALALRTAHPEWIAAAFADALGERPAGDGPNGERLAGDGPAGVARTGGLAETEAALRADDERPRTHLVAWPGRIGRDELAAISGGEPGPYSPYAVRMAGGDPGAVGAVRERRAAVQDEGSQLCALALANAPLTGRDERWLDLTAGPGGKTALLAALATGRGAHVTANELHPHRAELVRRATAGWDVEVRTGDGRALPGVDGGYDRVLLDAPCSGLGALRRRPEARWRRRPGEIAGLAALQVELLAAALRLVRPGGVVAYVTCSPHPAETSAIVEAIAAPDRADSHIDRPGARRIQSSAVPLHPASPPRVETLDARPAFPGVAGLGAGPAVQLWPHRHGTDAMFCALLRRVG